MWGASATSLGGAKAGSGSITSLVGNALTTPPTSGKFIYCVFTVNNSAVGSFTPPSGWTALLTSQDPGGSFTALCAKVADGTEGTTALTFGWTGSGHAEVGNVYQEDGGPSSLTSIEEVAVRNIAFGSNAANPYPAITGAAATTDSDELILWGFARISTASFSSWQVQGGFTSLEDQQSDGTATTGCGHTLARKVETANEAPSAQLNLSNGTREYNGWVIALKPAAAGGGSTTYNSSPSGQMNFSAGTTASSRLYGSSPSGQMNMSGSAVSQYYPPVVYNSVRAGTMQLSGSASSSYSSPAVYTSAPSGIMNLSGSATATLTKPVTAAKTPRPPFDPLGERSAVEMLTFNRTGRFRYRRS